MPRWCENDELFFQEARIGQHYIEQVGVALTTFGLSPVIPELRLRDHIDDAREEFANSRDIVCCGRIIEVKSRRVSFTSPDDFPYPEIIVSTVHGWHQKRSKPFAYVCVSQITGAMIATRGDSSARWAIERKWDHVRGIYDDFYLAPREAWRLFERLIAALREEA